MNKRIFFVFAILMVCFSGAAFAQQERATLTGTITDPTQAAIQGAKVEINSKETGFHREAVTNSSGTYTIPGLLIGNYEVTVRKEGFRTGQFSKIELTVGQVRTINKQMEIATSSTEMQVVSEAAALEQSSSTVGGVIGGQQVAELPLNGRAWTTLMTLVPGAQDTGAGNAKSIRFAGRAPDDTNYRFDGTDASGISAQSPNASLRLQISTEAIAEFKVDTALFGAESGGSAGGQVEIISKSGTNAFHGSAFEYLRNDALNTRGPFDGSTLPPLRLNQYGGSVGGPVIKNRTFFFAAYEGLRQRVGTTLIGNVPSDAYRAQVLAQSPVLAPIINAFPRGNRTLSANVSQFVSVGSLALNEDSGLIRVDHRFSDSTTFFARYNIDKALIASPSGTLLDTTQASSAPMNGSMTLSHVFSPTMFTVIQLGVNRISGVSHTDSNLYNVSKIVNSVSVSGFTKLNQQRDSVSAPTTYTLKNDWTWLRGKHAIKFGAEIKRVVYNYSQASENALVWASAATFSANQLDQVNLIGGVPMHGLLRTEYFGYIQDSYKVMPNLTVNAGLRYEFFNRFHEIYGRDLPFDTRTCNGFCPVGSEFSYPVTNNFEPRLSLAWSPKALGSKTVIRAGSGFYKGEGQLGDLNAPSDNYTTRLAISSNDFPKLSFPAEPFYTLAANQAVSPRALPRDRKDPTVIQWGLQLQTVLPAGFVLDTGYIGYHGYNQFTRIYVNVADPKTGLRPLPGFGPIDSKQTDSNNHFHGWQTSVQRRFLNGVSFTANYMWSHAINDGASGGGEGVYPQNNDCRACDTASSDTDIRHTFSANTVYRLPFGKGLRYMNQGGLMNAVLGGWEFSGTGKYRSALPVNVTITRSASAVPNGLSLVNGSTVQRPNYLGLAVYPATQTINSMFNPQAFALPANGTYGTLGRNALRGVDFWQADVSMIKSFTVTERIALSFRAEAFNVFNRAQFADPSGDFSSASFGRITSTINGSSPTGSGTPRQFQFSLRMRF